MNQTSTNLKPYLTMRNTNVMRMMLKPNNHNGIKRALVVRVHGFVILMLGF